MRVFRRAGLVLALIAAIAVVGWTRHDRRGTGPLQASDTPSASAAASAHAAAQAAPGRRTPRALEGETLVPVDIRDLKALADAGDARAACRLGSLLAECGVLAKEYFSDAHIEGLLSQERMHVKRGELENANAAAQGAMLARKRQQQCGDVPESLFGSAHAYLRQAALAGDLESRVRYLRGDAFRGIGFSEHQSLSSPQFDQWRAEAPGMLGEMLRAGHPEAVILLLEGHSSAGTVLSLITPPDPVLDEAYLQLAQRVFREFELPRRWPVEPADPQVRAEASRLAQQWHEAYFDGRRFHVATDLLGLSHALMPLEAQDWISEDAWAPACAPVPEAG